MRTCLAVFLAILVGVALGAGTAVLRVRSVAWDGGPEGDSPIFADHAWRMVPGKSGQSPFEGPTPSTTAASGPKVVVDREEFDFGSMDASEEGSHDFVLTNTGRSPLKLSSMKTSCRCTVSVLDKDEIAPGKSTKVALKWKAKEVVGAYRQTARISTNDPDRPVVSLTISGEITVAVRSDPPELVFSQIPPGEQASGEVRLWCHLAGPALEVLDFKLSDQDIAKYFAVEHTPLSSQRVQREKGAKSGVLLHVEVKPGLPQGPFQQTILLRTNLESNPAMVVPIKGQIGETITVAGPDWNRNRGVLNFGVVSRAAGAQRRLLLFVHGSHCNEVKFTPVRVVPDLIQVQVGETAMGGGSPISQTPLIIQIPAGSRSISLLGPAEGELGEIVLKSTHPAVPQVRILVRFAVEG